MRSYTSFISAAALYETLEGGHTAVFDCRFNLLAPEQGMAAWREAHIPGAHYAHLDNDLAGPTVPDGGRHPLPEPETFAAWLGARGVDTKSQVVAYDDAGGAIAARLWWLVRWLGHERVAVLDGGLDAWRSRGYPLDDRRPRQRASRQPLRGSPRAGSTQTTADVEALGPERSRLIDARDPARFRGEVEPIDPVAGHVPGARNLPFSELLDEAGGIRDKETLERRLLAVLDGDSETPWSVMCGSGVTACHLALAAEHAGLRAPKLYVDSFSGWIREPSRPVATEIS